MGRIYRGKVQEKESDHLMEAQALNFGAPVWAVEKMQKGQWVVFEDSDERGFFVRCARDNDLSIQKYLILADYRKGEQVVQIVKPMSIKPA